MTDELVKKKTFTNQNSLKIKEIQKVDHGGDSSFQKSTFTFRLGWVDANDTFI